MEILINIIVWVLIFGVLFLAVGYFFGTKKPFGQDKKVSCVIFVFDSQAKEITGNYARHAEDAIRARLDELDPRLEMKSFPMFCGDMLSPQNMGILLGDESYRPKIDISDSRIEAHLRKGESPGFMAYLIGLVMLPEEYSVLTDGWLKRDRVAGYCGIILFTLYSEKVISEISEMLLFTLTPLDSDADFSPEEIA